MHGPLATPSEKGGIERFFRALVDPATSRTHNWAAAGAVKAALKAMGA